MHDESETLFPEARTKAGHHEVARAGVTQEDLPLGVGVEGLYMVHELPAAQRAPPLLVHVRGAGARLVEVTFPDVVLG